MMKSYNLVASYVNIERVEDKAGQEHSIYTPIWYNWPKKKSAFLREIAERSIKN